MDCSILNFIIDPHVIHTWNKIKLLKCKLSNFHSHNFVATTWSSSKLFQSQTNSMDQQVKQQSKLFESIYVIKIRINISTWMVGQSVATWSKEQRTDRNKITIIGLSSSSIVTPRVKHLVSLNRLQRGIVC